MPGFPATHGLKQDHSVCGVGRLKSRQQEHEVSLRTLRMQSAQANSGLLLLWLQPPEQTEGLSGRSAFSGSVGAAVFFLVSIAQLVPKPWLAQSILRFEGLADHCRARVEEDAQDQYDDDDDGCSNSGIDFLLHRAPSFRRCFLNAASAAAGTYR